MPDHVFTIVARGHVIDAQTNTLTLFSVVEQLGGPSLPLNIPELSIVTLWARTGGEENAGYEQRTRIVSPDGSELRHVDVPFRFEKPRMRVLLGLQGLPIEMLGTYHVEILIRRAGDPNWSAPLAKYPIEVSLPPSPANRHLFQSPT